MAVRHSRSADSFVALAGKVFQAEFGDPARNKFASNRRRSCERRDSGAIARSAAFLAGTFSVRLDASVSRPYVHRADHGVAGGALFRTPGRAESFPQRSNTKTCSASAWRSSDSRNLFLMAGYRSVSSKVTSALACGLCAGFTLLRRAFFSAGR